MRKTVNAALLAGFLAATAAPALAQDTATTGTAVVPATEIEEDDGMDLGWLGLLGLAGLLGLRRKRDDHVRTTPGAAVR